MAVGGIFLTATEARNNSKSDIILNQEVRTLEYNILINRDLGFYECTVSDGTPMTASSFTSALNFTVDAGANTLSCTDHGLGTGDILTVTSTVNLPPPLATATYYYAIYVDQDTIKLASSLANAKANVPISLDLTQGVVQVNLSGQGSGYFAAPTVHFSGGNPSQSATAVSTLLTYGSLANIILTTSGSGYTDVPSVSVDNVGSGATAGSVYFKVVDVTIAGAGSGYANGTYTCVVVTGTGSPHATLGVTVTGNVVSGVTIATAGNYDSLNLPTNPVSVSGLFGGGGATFNLNYGLYQIDLASGGLDYTDIPKVTISGGGGSGAQASVTFSGSSVDSFVVTDPGTNYTSPPTIDVTTGSGAIAQVELAPTSIGLLNLTSGGAGYTATPVVSLDPQGTGATPGTVAFTVVSASIVSGGSNYVVGDQLVVSGGVGSQCIISVDTVNSSGTITSWTIYDGGSYTSLPSPTANHLLGGSGYGATTNLSFGIESIAVLTGGTGYVVPPTVVITSVDGSNAKARAVLTGNSVSEIVIINSGTGYTTSPTIYFTAGQGASASALLTPTSVQSISMDNNGSGYTTASVTITGGGGVGATASANIVGGSINSISMISNGSGYTSTPTVTITGDGVNAAATANLSSTSVASITLEDGGENWVAPAIVTISGGTATAISALTSTSITRINVLNGGSDYSVDPIISLSDGALQFGTPVEPVIDTVRSYGVGYVTVTDPGVGYTSTPDVTLSAPPTGTTATANAVLGNGQGEFSLQKYFSSQDYYKVFKGYTPSSSLYVRPMTEQMNKVITYFTDLGYTITRSTNSTTNTTFGWTIKW